MARKLGLMLATMTLAAVAKLGPAEAALYLPERVAFLSEPKTKACGIRADYALSGATLRVEVLATRDGDSIGVMARAYQPNSVGPLMRDIWLKSASLFTLGRFRPAVENGNGILEARGSLTPLEGEVFLDELTDGAVEISVIFDGVMPMARLPVGLPSPLPEAVAQEFSRCLGG